jgi:hypothetical protein
MPLGPIWFIDSYDVDLHARVATPDNDMQRSNQIGPSKNKAGRTALVIRIVLENLRRIPAYGVFQFLGREAEFEHFSGNLSW